MDSEIRSARRFNVEQFVYRNLTQKPEDLKRPIERLDKQIVRTQTPKENVEVQAPIGEQA